MNFSKLTILFLMVLIVSGCISIKSPHYGIVKDAETGNPIKSVVVHLDQKSAFLGGPETHINWRDSFEVFTDESGNYKFSMNAISQAPLEISAGETLSFIKAGYYESYIHEPSLNNTVTLYPIKYFLDYSHYKENAKKGDKNPPYIENKPEAFANYKKELFKMTTLKFESFGESGRFISVPNAQFDKISCRTEYNLGNNSSKQYTFGISGNICILFDEVSRKTMTFDAQGNIKELYNNNNAPTEYTFLAAAPHEENTIFASRDSIYVSNYVSPYSKMFSNVIPQKGHITALAGDSNEYLTLEDDGSYLCYFSTWRNIGTGCFSIDDVFLNMNEDAKFIALTHLNNNTYFIFSKKASQYQLHSVTHKYDSSGNWTLGFSEPLFTPFPVEDEIIDFISNERFFFIAFKKSGIKKYSWHMYENKGVLKEEESFYRNSYNLFTDNPVKGIDIGRSVYGRFLYVTVGNSTVYRLSLDGLPDYEGRAIE